MNSSASPRPAGELPGLDDAGDIFATAQALMHTRQTVLPKRLLAPGPTPQQLEALLALAAAAPDHGQLTPWRFILVPPAQRHRLAEAFASALRERDPDATAAQLEAASEKAHRAPTLLIAIAALGPREPDIPPLERVLSLGAAVQNLLLGAHALGFGAGLTSGQAMSSPQMAALCGLRPGEAAICCVNIGTVSQRKPPSRLRPPPAQFFSELT